MDPEHRIQPNATASSSWHAPNRVPFNTTNVVLDPTQAHSKEPLLEPTPSLDRSPDSLFRPSDSDQLSAAGSVKNRSRFRKLNLVYSSSSSEESEVMCWICGGEIEIPNPSAKHAYRIRDPLFVPAHWTNLRRIESNTGPKLVKDKKTIRSNCYKWLANLPMTFEVDSRLPPGVFEWYPRPAVSRYPHVLRGTVLNSYGAILDYLEDATNGAIIDRVLIALSLDTLPDIGDLVARQFVMKDSSALSVNPFKTNSRYLAHLNRFPDLRRITVDITGKMPAIGGPPQYPDPYQGNLNGAFQSLDCTLRNWLPHINELVFHYQRVPDSVDPRDVWISWKRGEPTISVRLELAMDAWVLKQRSLPYDIEQSFSRIFNRVCQCQAWEEKEVGEVEEVEEAEEAEEVEEVEGDEEYEGDEENEEVVVDDEEDWYDEEDKKMHGGRRMTV